MAEVYQDFILAKTAEGVSDVTIRNYHQHLHNISKYLDIEQPMAALSKRDLESMVCEMRAAELAIAHYNRSHGVEKTGIHLALHHFW